MPISQINTNSIANGAVVAADLAAGAARANFGAGAVLQVVQGALTSQVIVTSTSFIDIGLSANITPSATSSKILIMYGLQANGYTDNEYANIRLFRNSTNLLTGDADGNRTPSFSTVGGISNFTSMVMSSGMYLDSPSSTSSINYSVRVRSYDASGANSAYINRPLTKDDLSNCSSPCSTIILMEIAG